MEEATAIAGMVELQVSKASPEQGENGKSSENACSAEGLNTGLVYTPMRITRSMASFRSAFSRSLGLSSVGEAAEAEGEEEAEAEAEHASPKKTGKRSTGRGARKEWKSSVVEQVDAEAQVAARKKGGNAKSRSKAADSKRSKAQAQAQGGKKKTGRTSSSKMKEKQGESVDQAEPGTEVGEDISSGVTEGETAKTNQVQIKQKTSPSSSVGWVMCDDCSKWRCISAELADQIESSDVRWTCRENPNKKYADCSVPQEKTNAEINEELNISDVSTSDCDDTDAVVSSKSRATWTRIRHNIFAHRTPKKVDEDDLLICTCKPPKDGLGCGDGCYNRMMNVECTAESCPCGDRCSNQQFQKRTYANFAFVRCGKKGFGLRAREFIPEGTFIIEYVGEVLDSKAFEMRQRDYARQRQKHFYFMSLIGGEIIDACRKGNHGRFINHSCDPNCKTDKWCVNGEICIGLFAVRNIRENEEITFNYNFERLCGAAAKKCRCGSANCQGYIGGDPSSPMDVVPSDSEDDLEPIMLKEDDDSEEEDLMDIQESAQDMKTTPASEALPWEPSLEPETEPEPDRECVPQPKLEPVPETESKPKPLPKVPEAKLKTKTRIKRLKSSGRPRKTPLKPFNPITVPRRSISEVEEKLDKLLNEEGGLLKKKDTPKQYLKLLVLSAASGDSSASCNMRDVSLLLDAILKTASRSILTEVMQKNGLQLFHNLVKQSRKSFTKIPILRKVLKVLDFFAEKGIINSQDMTLTASRNSMESFVKSIFELQRHEDAEVQHLSRRFQRQWLPDALDLLAHENSGNQTVQRYRGPERYSQRRELFLSRPDDRQRKFKRPEDAERQDNWQERQERQDNRQERQDNWQERQDRNPDATRMQDRQDNRQDRQERNPDAKRRRISRWDEAPMSTPSHQSRSGSQELRPSSRRDDEQCDAAEPPGYSSKAEDRHTGSKHLHPPEPADYHNQPAGSRHSQPADYQPSSRQPCSRQQPADYQPGLRQQTADYHPVSRQQTVEYQPGSRQQTADYQPGSRHQAADYHSQFSGPRQHQAAGYHSQHGGPRQQAADYHSQFSSSRQQQAAGYHSQSAPSREQPADYHSHVSGSKQQPSEYYSQPGSSRQHATEYHSHPASSRYSYPQQPADYHSQPRDNWSQPRDTWSQQSRERWGYRPPSSESSYYNDYAGRRQYPQGHQGMGMHSFHPRRGPPASRPLPANGYYNPPPYHPHVGVEASSHYRSESGCYSYPHYPVDDEPPVPGL